MYSHEIDELIRLKKYVISNIEYFKICDSPQVDHVEYKEDGSGYDYNINTNDGYSWKVKVYKDERNK